MSIVEKATEFAGLPVIEYQTATGLVLPVMPWGELRHDEKPDEFWAISLEQDRVIVSTGKAGTGGKEQTRKFASPAIAQEKYRDFVAAKAVEGWRQPRVHREFHLSTRPPKFWSITVTGRSRVFVSGRVATNGKVSIRTFKTEAAALADCERLIARRLEEGYTEQKPMPGSLRESFIAAIRADPADVASRNAFVDYLSDQGERLPLAAWRVDGGRWRYGGAENLASFLNDPAVGLVEALVVGACWGEDGKDSANAVETLIAARDRLRNLRALFLGDILREEYEISWIKHSDITGLFEAFPNLELFRVRGGEGLALREFRHEKLTSLAFEASNLSREVVLAIGASDLPALEHLELWLGTSDYGADTTPADLADILQGERLPSLRYLGLRNSEIADYLPAVLAGAPVMDRLRVLDLSLGILTDRGAEALLAIPGLCRLEKLDLHHNCLSPAMVECLNALGTRVEAGNMEADGIGGQDYRYVAHSE